MRKINSELENQIVVLTEKGQSAREIAKTLKICHSTVLCVRKRRNAKSINVTKGRPRLLTDGDARLMERLMRSKDTKTPKLAAKAINKNVSECRVERFVRSDWCRQSNK